ncbi:MAG: N-acetyl-gamma-glutamyl-phosphate reductase [Pseudomonadota bacterium]
MAASIPSIVIGSTGYVGGEFLRLIAAHPNFELAAAVSRDTNSVTISEVFGHLAQVYPDVTFQSPDHALAIARQHESLALFSAAPHGGSAALIEPFIERAETNGTRLHVVDASADYRFANQSDFEAVYKCAHPAPQRLAQFSCALPEHAPGNETPHKGNPGCFATAMLLASVPLIAGGFARGDLFACGITGSTGSGKAPLPTTHHPVRHSNLYSYKALNHRHVPEVESLIRAATGHDAKLRFVPHSGPFARGIHMTVQAPLANTASEQQLNDYLREFYANAPFVNLVSTPPRVKDVAGSNFALLHATVADSSIAVSCVIDNLIKGAAGGAVQWMNRLFELPETCGLESAAPGWI